MSDQAARDESLNPACSILLQAPAGSGKTTVLAQRFLRLLAEVNEPEEILAITFTRKSAAEMRERVLRALQDELSPDQSDIEQWRSLRRAALARANACGWSLTELPARLRIQTIDSLNHEFARAMPLLGGLQTSLNVVDDASAMYRQAARLTLREADQDGDFQEDVDCVLQRLDNSNNRTEELLAELLASRNRWQPVLLETPPEQLAARTAASLERIITDVLQQVMTRFDPDLRSEGMALARDVVLNLAKSERKISPELAVWQNSATQLETHAASLQAWQGLASLALKADGDWRLQVTVGHGFPPDQKAHKQRWRDWIERLQRARASQPLLQTILSLPQARIDSQEAAALTSLARLMLLAAAQLKLVFRDSGLVDHPEVAAVARQALLQSGEATELSIRQSLRVRHLLVDEFQDTSPDQVELVQALMQGWEQGEGRSLFLVGDPMQSIYLFRNSEVGLFLRVRAEGIGEIRLRALQLQRNFRSLPALVQWSNDTFDRIFPVLEDLRSSAVTFLPALAARQSPADAEPAVSIWPQATDEAEPEAAQIAAEIARLRQHDPNMSIAVLVQTRALAPPVLDALAQRGIATLGVDLAPLSQHLAVRDLVSIGQAVLNAAHRTAWLAVLRAPFCGLTLADLHTLCAADKQALLIDRIGDEQILDQLSTDGSARLRRCGPLLLRAWSQRGQRSLARQVSALWRQLGGMQACRSTAELSAAEQYLLALQRLEEAEPHITAARLQKLADRLRDDSTTGNTGAVEILTLHHSKGLEWDAVFIPGLGRKPRNDNPPLLRWLQLPAAGNDTDLLMAVYSMGEENSSSPLAAYIRGLQTGRLHNERVRLAYVGVTRARQRLYLSGHAPTNRKTGEPQPVSHSQLDILWPALREHFVNTLPAINSEPETVSTSPLVRSQWQRLPANFECESAVTLPQVMGLVAAQTEGRGALEFSWVGPLARAVGTVIHAELERLAPQGIPAAADFQRHVDHYRLRLHELGATAQEAFDRAPYIAAQLARLVGSDRLRWLLAAEHKESRSEWCLSGMVAGQLRSVVIDRSFVDRDGSRWVVDFKTSTHSGGGLDDFLQSELQRYRGQLQLYQELAQRTGPEPVRAALYFPLLGEFRELT
jgi:ATP-dependent helicase/nuclease subunit A